MKIVITGSAGFIGSYLLKRLRNTNHELLLLDIKDGIDICKSEQVLNISEADVVVHLANLSFVPASYTDPKRFYEINYLSTLNMLELCRLTGAKLVYLSSYVYGPPQYQPIDESHPVHPFNPYAQTKIICESLCEGYNRDFNVPITIFRPFNCYGTGQNPDFLIPGIIRQAQEGRIVVKDERPKRDYIHVEDVAHAIELAIESEHSEKEVRVLNLGTGVSISVKEVVDVVTSLFDADIEYRCTNEFRPNEVMDTVADIAKIQQMFNWKPKINFKQGIKMMVDLS